MTIVFQLITQQKLFKESRLHSQCKHTIQLHAWFMQRHNLNTRRIITLSQKLLITTPLFNLKIYVYKQHYTKFMIVGFVQYQCIACHLDISYIVTCYIFEHCFVQNSIFVFNYGIHFYNLLPLTI